MEVKYDYYERYPKSRKNSVIAVVILLLIVNVCLVLSKFLLVWILFSIIFNCLGILILISNYKDQILIFADYELNINWSTIFKRINRIILATEIKKVQFKLRRIGKENSSYMICIFTDTNIVKMQVIPAQYYDLKEYFESFCANNNIMFIGNKGNTDNDF